MPDHSELGDNTRVATAYPQRTQYQLWEEVKPDDKSMSAFIVDTVNQHAAKKKTSPQSSENHGDQGRVEELEQENQRLQQQLEEAENTGNTGSVFSDPEYVKQFLSPTQTKRLPELLQEIVESGSLDQFIRQPVENTLYELASDDEAEYSRGKTTGWKLTENRGDNS